MQSGRERARVDPASRKAKSPGRYRRGSILTSHLRPQRESNEAPDSSPPSSETASQPEKTAAPAIGESASESPVLAADSTPIPVPVDEEDALLRELQRARRERRWVDADLIQREIDDRRAV